MTSLSPGIIKNAIPGLRNSGSKTTEWRHFLSMMVLLIEFQERATKAGETAASNRNKNGTEDRREKKWLLPHPAFKNSHQPRPLPHYVPIGRFWQILVDPR